jgi:2-oxoisovalerate dehydrogenase E2 component (dihydrolipoyl transacylase)
MTELKQFKLPDVGEGLTEADIVKWHVRPGDKVAVNQTIVEIETAKAIVELPSPYAGVVTDLLVSEGETVDVGTPIISVDVSGSAPGQTAGAKPDSGRLPRAAPAGRGAQTSVQSTAAAAPAGGRVTPDSAAPTQVGAAREDGGPPLVSVNELVPSPPAEGAVEPGLHGSPAPRQARQPVLVGYGVKLGAATRRPRKAAPAQAPAAAAPARDELAGTADEAGTPGASTAAPAAATEAGAAGRVAVLAKPPVRKLARQLGVDLSAVAPTGPAGSITRADVQRAADAAAERGAGEPEPALPGVAAVVGAAAAGPREERIAVRGVRKHTAAAVVASAFSAPHVTEFLQVDVTAAMAAVRQVRDLPEFADIRVSPLLFVAKALLLAVARNPMINSSWDEAAQEIVVKRYVNLGIAAATNRGLIVPNIKDAHALPMTALARGINALAETARAGKTTPADLQGGTITITNVGVFGVDAGTPILTPGEAAILAFGQVRDMPWVHEGALAVRKVTTLSLSFDHRVVDGDLGSAVLRDVGAMLEDPVRMLAWS